MFFSFFLMNIMLFFFLKNFIIFSFSINNINFFFFVTVIIVFTSIFFFSFYYLNSNKNFFFFFIWLLLFVFSMILLITSKSIFFMFIGWDGLGITSFILVNFFKNWITLNNSLITFMSNRIGDVFFFFFFSFFIWSWKKNFFFLKTLNFLIIFISMTKSAQFPIMSWLPAAMAAPTPVSALVHSSTLVTAGVLLLILMNFFLNFKLLLFIFFLSFLTILTAGISAIWEKDFKKLVAFSTLSQMGFLFLMISNMKYMLCLFHLFSHAFFKSMLFMSVGSILHSSNSSQESRSFLKMNKNSKLSILSLNVSMFNLMGLFFLSGFYSKDFFFFFSSKIFNFLFFIYIFIISLTIFYSFKMFFFLLNWNWKKKKENSKTLNISLLNVFFLSILYGSFMSNNFISFFEFNFFFFSLNTFLFLIFFFILSFFFFFKKNNLMNYLLGIFFFFFLLLKLKINIYNKMEKNLIDKNFFFLPSIYNFFFLSTFFFLLLLIFFL